MADPLLARALVRWQHAAGPYWPYVCATPFLGVGEGDVLAREWVRAATRAARPPGHQADALVEQVLAAVDSPHALLVDLPIEPLLAAAPCFVRRGWYVVPVVQRWIARPAVLPCRGLVGRLLAGARSARRPEQPRGVVLLADGERTGRSGAPAQVRGRTFDNRYEYQICRFPSPAFLVAQGVRQLHWITPPAGGAAVVRPDLEPYQEALLLAGLDVEVSAWPSPA